MQVKTAEATGLQLDWGLAKVMGAKRIIVNWRGVWVEDEGFKVGDDCRGWVCHTDPAVCMGLIEGWKINIKHIHYSTPNRAVLASWGSTLDDSGYMQAFGGTVAEAVARCIISMKLGDEFECPSELGGDGMKRYDVVLGRSGGRPHARCDETPEGAYVRHYVAQRLIDAKQAEIDALKAQNAELLAAVECILRDNVIPNAQRRVAQNAIAKARGEQNV